MKSNLSAFRATVRFFSFVSPHVRGHVLFHIRLMENRKITNYGLLWKYQTDYCYLVADLTFNQIFDRMDIRYVFLDMMSLSKTLKKKKTNTNKNKIPSLFLSNTFPQSSHLNGLSPLWICMCLSKCSNLTIWKKFIWLRIWMNNRAKIKTRIYKCTFSHSGHCFVSGLMITEHSFHWISVFSIILTKSLFGLAFFDLRLRGAVELWTRTVWFLQPVCVLNHYKTNN